MDALQKLGKEINEIYAHDNYKQARTLVDPLMDSIG